MKKLFSYMHLKEMINFEIACVLLEIKTKFNLEHFKQIEDLNNQVAYAKKHLSFLGEGSSRIVFVLSNRYVLKIAHPQNSRKGTAQNKSEIQVYTNPKTKSVVSAIYDFDPNYYRWVVSEIVRPLKSSQEFEQMAGISWELFTLGTKNPKQFESVVSEEIEEKQKAIENLQKRYKSAEGNSQAQKVVNNKIERLNAQISNLQNATKNPILLGAINLINTAGVVPGDINFWDHWGKTTDGRLVLYDYGLTRDIVHLYQ